MYVCLHRSPPEVKVETEEQGKEHEELDDEEELMKKIMGFSKFDSTKVSA